MPCTTAPNHEVARRCGRDTSLPASPHASQTHTTPSGRSGTCQASAIRTRLPSNRSHSRGTIQPPRYSKPPTTPPEHVDLDYHLYMAAVSLSPSPISAYPLAMSSRRVPLASNPNVANSPVRSTTSTFAAVLSKHRQQKRTHASIQREESYGQPPPNKKKLLNDGTEQPLRSPVRQVKVVRKDLARAYKDEKLSQNSGTKAAVREDETARVQRWKSITRANFPNFVFYFESVPNDQRAKLVRQLTQLGAVSLTWSQDSSTTTLLRIDTYKNS